MLQPAEREMLLLKLRAPPGPARTEVLQLAQIFRARVVDVAERTLTLCVSGDPGKVCGGGRLGGWVSAVMYAADSSPAKGARKERGHGYGVSFHGEHWRESSEQLQKFQEDFAATYGELVLVQAGLWP
jgi:hypothetical protein